MNVTKRKIPILIVAGEASGDMHGAGLVRELKKKNPNYQFFGICGEMMEKEGVEPIHHVREMSFLGFFEVVKHLPFIRQVLKNMTTLMEERKPSLIILIDYPGFNLKLAKEAKKREIPVIYYISPQVWAWRKKRIKKIARRIDKMIVIFPFEEDLYRKEGVDVQFVGHPLCDTVKVNQSKEEFFEEIGMDYSKPTIGLLPGSREQEVRRLLPEMEKACSILRQKIPGLQIILGKAPMLPDKIYKQFLSENTYSVRNKTYEVMAHSDVVIVASGTATLETALLGTPMVILYRMSPLSFLLGKSMVRVKHIGLVNIVAGKEIVPELIQGKAKGKRIAEEVLPLLTDKERSNKIKEKLREMSHKLGGKGATERTARAVVEFIEMN